LGMVALRAAIVCGNHHGHAALCVCATKPQASGAH
jgi:hypothetical protein